MKQDMPEIMREAEGRTVTFRVEAPFGYVWNDGFVHEMVNNCYRGNRKWETEAKAELKERMAAGLSKCDTPECEWCGDE